MSHMESEARWGRLRTYYEVGEVIGTGATGMVVSAIRKGDGREVAIKVLKPALVHDLDLVQSLEREAAAGRAIRHPGVLPVLGQGRLDDDTPYVVFARLRGESLLSLLSRRERLSVAEAAWIAQRIASVLVAVHGAGYVHRDIKPEHVMLAPDRARVRPYLLDFGVCQPPDSDVIPYEHERGRVFGTPGYLAPEQARGDQADPRSDLYSLGTVLFEMLTGKPPFPGRNAARALHSVLSEDPPRLEPSAELPLPLCQLVNRLLAREPEDRPENARAVARALVPLVGDELMVERMVAARLRLAGAVSNVPTRRLPAPSVQRILAAQG